MSSVQSRGPHTYSWPRPEAKAWGRRPPLTSPPPLPRLSVPAGFLLATILGTACLAIASSIYLLVSGIPCGSPPGTCHPRPQSQLCRQSQGRARVLARAGAGS